MTFDERVVFNQGIVSTWPAWMQRIVITAETASTGKFIDEDKDIVEV